MNNNIWTNEISFLYLLFFSVQSSIRVRQSWLHSGKLIRWRTKTTVRGTDIFGIIHQSEYNHNRNILALILITHPCQHRVKIMALLDHYDRNLVSTSYTIHSTEKGNKNSRLNRHFKFAKWNELLKIYPSFYYVSQVGMSVKYCIVWKTKYGWTADVIHQQNFLRMGWESNSNYKGNIYLGLEKQQHPNRARQGNLQQSNNSQWFAQVIDNNYC